MAYYPETQIQPRRVVHKRETTDSASDIRNLKLLIQALREMKEGCRDARRILRH